MPGEQPGYFGGDGGAARSGDEGIEVRGGVFEREGVGVGEVGGYEGVEFGGEGGEGGLGHGLGG